MPSYRTTSAMMLGFFLLVVIGAGLVIGLTIQPGAWYASLNKPFFNPPNWIFGPVWTTLYILIAIAGWRTWLIEGVKGRAIKIWIGQMILNWLWTPLFFGAHAMSLGLTVILCLLLLILYFIAIARDKVARFCFFPYALWVGFASVLNASLLWLNG
ncbi:TspO/MBR family protein [Rhizobium leguminosarum]|uniref:TspO/MBR family protein n=1 Tax=Rhizobium leguminosarum TaxID=384 RepID=UPI001031D9DE|nr:TspO/MBR family protein [Rhizobium leguminosarum]TAU81077.1 tryptophan-rich sensory protein [Rhizobium leguminosarum]TAV46379.1 tryptophan-rich sensory protein [Rhizobium leguminosarum]